ncbi:MAG: FAD-dependent oxidoreductase [Elainella sp.]
METITTEVLVVGGGTGGVAAALQAARRGARTVLVSESNWLGGMLTSAGVTAPDGLELLAFQTGIWGEFLRELRQRQPQGLDHAWVSFFTYEPRIGARIFADWVTALPNLHWIWGQIPQAVQKQGERVTGVRFQDYQVTAQITLDATELGDLLALAEIPYRWGWEWQSEWQEASAPVHPNTMTQTYAVQAPTWVFGLRDFGPELAPALPPPDSTASSLFDRTWEGYGPEQFLNYGRLPGNCFMINWPEQGNDYGLQANRLIESDRARQDFWQEAHAHAYSYACWLQHQLGRRYGLAADLFPGDAYPAGRFALGGGAFALHPYYRESRRLVGQTTIREQDILPVSGGQAASLPCDAAGEVRAIAIGNYVNDHHYPGFRLALQPKSMRWGGRWTGTPFALPYDCLVPTTTTGLLVCEKNISVSHIANGATRLQPTVLGLGQVAGMAAVLCVEQGCQPQELPVRLLQSALLQDPTAPLAVLPLFNLLPGDPDWRYWQDYYLDHPDAYPASGYAPRSPELSQTSRAETSVWIGLFEQRGVQDYGLQIESQTALVQLVTLHPEIDRQLLDFEAGQRVQVWGRRNRAGNWLLVEAIELKL